ncbi:hypothetical protein EJP67_33195 [Variovorax guangxiensis]|uniref:Uncharacterized protein n=1 Tax=Variovorax guangxiensis TaxID=1775474 RepID=A0A3S1A824_9BURK|nr:hypothetical protein [Variovorax guangxiensis]RUR71915.1 hypothetical protein EJP67_33195 [Variovorax guangxiensis]
MAPHLRKQDTAELIVNAISNGSGPASSELKHENAFREIPFNETIFQILSAHQIGAQIVRVDTTPANLALLVYNRSEIRSIHIRLSATIAHLSSISIFEVSLLSTRSIIFTAKALTRGIPLLVCLATVGCSNYSPPANAPTAELQARILGFSSRQHGGVITVATPQCGDKAWWPKQLFTNVGYSSKTRPEGKVAVQAGRPIVLSYSHSYPFNSSLNAVCGNRLIVNLEQSVQYEATATMTLKPDAARSEPPGYCTFELVEMQTRRPVPTTSLGCDATQ